MKSVIISAAVTAGLLTSGAAMANADLAQKSECLACHATDKKLVGPAFKDVAKKYAGDKAAEAKVAESITKGGSGKWGPVPMPPKGGKKAVSDADVKTLAKWIVGGAK